MANNLSSARAKLENPDLGALTPEEMTALLAATQEPKRTHGDITENVVEQILDVTAEFPRDKAKSVILALFKEKNASFVIEKTWTDDDFQKISVGY